MFEWFLSVNLNYFLPKFELFFAQNLRILKLGVGFGGKFNLQIWYGRRWYL